MKLLSYFTHHLLITHTNYNRIPYHVQFSFCDKISSNFQFPWLALECRDLDHRTKKQTINLVRITERKVGSKPGRAKKNNYFLPQIN